MIDLAWENERLELPISKDTFLQVLEPSYPPKLDNHELERNLENHLNSIREELSKARRIVLILEDPSRPTRTTRMMSIIGEILHRIRGRWDGFEIVIAAGAHYHIQQEQISVKVDALFLPVSIHNCRSADGLEKVGATKRGIPFYINKKVVEADFRLTVSTTNIHHLAGFSGGGKIILPGVAGLETIEALHSLPPGRPGIRECAMRNLIDEAVSYVPINYSWHLIANSDGDLVKLFFDKMPGSHLKSKLALLRLITLPKPEAAQVLILGCRPFNHNIIGTFKSLHHIPKLLKSGGKAVLFNEAPEGVGFHHWRTQAKVVENQKKFYREFLKDYQVGVFSPRAKLFDFKGIFPDEIILLRNMDDLIKFLNRPEPEKSTFLPFAPITLVSEGN